MSGFILRRLLAMIPTLLIISVIVFILIQLPPGDIISATLASLQQQGMEVSTEQIAALRAQYNLDDPMVVQYLRWITHFVQGDLGYSIKYQQPVNTLIWDRLGYTVLIAVASLLFTWALAIPIGIYSAVRQYGFGDYFFTVVGLLGLAIPNFMLALILMYCGYSWFGVSVGGLFSPELAEAPWSSAKFMDLLKHIWIPMIVIGTAGTASIMRVMRANLLDELSKPYVVTARAKGVRPLKLIMKYPVRIAINPFISTIGWLLPTLISGEAIVSIVLNLPTTGPLLLQALLSQDMYLAGSFIMLLSILTVLGMLLSDILLAALDPRIRYE
ncbi:MAG: ABC transporter permease [Pseudomonadales bacterium]|jgi:peptide/nickel transport system permease protein|nr:ABC transporter permease [Pseudomonadales bacterium]MDP4641186.1 ABC transporter permease [Pseudomonadales bacterium]MDP4875279.1 ABC transporter permease [Pseudomonadales bacterium]MDP4912166.1 ABC transporter permease [Pseudomonadales bacterium]MDP5058638.1 ABC transporter permease [Pseudomonadales bacterium]